MSVDSPIDFPSSPLNGQTYDFQGVRYTWKDTSGGSGADGFWQVVAPYTYGSASEIEVNEGVSATKFITPYALANSEYKLNATRNNELDIRTAGTRYNDNIKAFFGTGNDSSVFHTGSAMKIDSTVGSIDINSTQGIRLLHNSASKLETLSTGISVNGDVGCITVTATGNIEADTLAAVENITTKNMTSSGTIDAYVISCDKLNMAAGNAAFPTITFGDVNTGFYQVSPDVLGISTGGNNRLTISDSEITANNTLNFLTGSEAAPAITFYSDANSGFYAPSQDSIGISVNGNGALKVDQVDVTSYKPLYVFTSSSSGSYATRIINNTSLADGISVQVRNNRYNFVGIDDGGTDVSFRVHSNGDVQNANNSYGTISDRRIKQDISTAKSQWQDIKKVQLHNYRITKQVDKDGEDAVRHLGVMAQDLQEAGMGGLVQEDNEGTLTVKTSVLYMKALGALVEAMGRIESLEETVNNLGNLRERVEELETTVLEQDMIIKTTYEEIDNLNKYVEEKID